MSRCFVACLLTVLGACASQPRYIVTEHSLEGRATLELAERAPIGNR